jgi:hypothetical protein
MSRAKAVIAARKVALVAAATAAIGAVVAVPAASARSAHDPCGSDQAEHVQGSLHCGRVFEIPAHHTWELPENDMAPRCYPRSRWFLGAVAPAEAVEGAAHYRGPGLSGDWDYWTRNGEWVLWNGSGHMPRGQDDQPINVRPWFHNWGAHPWPVRVYFKCTMYRNP